MVSSEFVKAVFRQGNRRSGRATVVPAKAGIQEILREKSGPATEGSGFRLSPERRWAGMTVGGNDGVRE